MHESSVYRQQSCSLSGLHKQPVRLSCMQRWQAVRRIGMKYEATVYRRVAENLQAYKFQPKVVLHSSREITVNDPGSNDCHPGTRKCFKFDWLTLCRQRCAICEGCAGSETSLLKCSMGKCGLFYHLACALKNPLTHSSETSTSFRSASPGSLPKKCNTRKCPWSITWRANLCPGS